MLSNLRDARLKEVVAMIVFNCLSDDINLLETEDGRWLVVSIMQHCCEYADAEWGLYLLEKLVQSNDFNKLYDQLTDQPNLRSVLIDVMHTQMESAEASQQLPQESEDSSSKSDILSIPERSLLFLAADFQTRCQCVLMLASNDEDLLQKEGALVMKLLALLCLAT